MKMKKIVFGMMLSALTISANAQHIVNLKSGEKMNGKVQSMKDGVINFEFKGNVMKLNVDEVSSIIFNEGSGTTKPATADAIKKEPGEKQIVAEDHLVRYKVADRTIAKPPLISNLTQEKGTVVVNISIDKYGHVIKAVPGGVGSTTTSEYLLTKAKQAAESTLFDNVPKAPLEQKGYMIIPF
jgi:hypothetical protein